MARMVARTKLTDVAEGSVLFSLMQTVAEQIAESDVRLAGIREQFTLEGASGVDLDERAEDIGIERLSAVRATGEVTLYRTDTVGALTIPLGSVIGRTDSAVTYSTLSAVTMNNGESEITVSVRASVAGSAGNAPTRALDVLSDVPDAITSIVQGEAIGNGRDEETDNQLRSRATRYLNSLARCQPVALEYLATSFTASDETRATTATLYELPTERGRCELLIDDGSGLGDHAPKRAGVTTTTTINAVGGLIIGVEAPIVDEVTVTDITSPVQSFRLIEGTDYVVFRERGLVHLLDGASVSVGSVLSVSGYEVYTGLIAELQRTIEGNTGDVSSGYRPAGVSVRVLPAPVQRVNLDLLIAVVDGANVQTVSDNVETAVASFFSSLGAGEPAFIAKVIDIVMGVDDVKNVTVYRQNTRNLEVDQYPNSPRTVLRSGEIRAITSITGA